MDRYTFSVHKKGLITKLSNKSFHVLKIYTAKTFDFTSSEIKRFNYNVIKKWWKYFFWKCIYGRGNISCISCTCLLRWSIFNFLRLMHRLVIKAQQLQSPNPPSSHNYGSVRRAAKVEQVQPISMGPGVPFGVAANDRPGTIHSRSGPESRSSIVQWLAELD